jgi:hypothetical protein
MSPEAKQTATIVRKLKRNGFTVHNVEQWKGHRGGRFLSITAVYPSGQETEFHYKFNGSRWATK